MPREGDVSNVTVLQDFPFKRTDEGRAMMQIVQDVAPETDKIFPQRHFYGRVPCTNYREYGRLRY